MKNKTPEQFSKADVQRFTVARQTMLVKSLTNSLEEISGNTFWEELTCVGYNPEKTLLEAVVEVKQPTGYSGGLCTNGSFEYVRFFIDWGSGFEDVGFTSFKVFDISNAPAGAQHPLEYLAVLELDESNHKRLCNFPVLPKVRAVLSWNTIPSTDPENPPGFGNAKDCSIQINPRKPIFSDLNSAINTKELFDPNILKNIDPDFPLPINPPAPLIIDEHYVKDYKAKKIPDHRAFYSMVKSNSTKISLSTPSLSISKAFLEEYKIDFNKIYELINSDKANINYEELMCVGLNSSQDKLGAIIKVKLPSGFSGELCDNGSFEHVAFWADWNNNGTWDEYLGTASVKVFDFTELPDGGLCYAVELPIDVSQHLKPCKFQNIIKVRGVLSWSSLPSTTDPEDLNTWGNRIDSLVQIRPGIKITGNQPGHRMDYIGNVAVNQIDASTHLAFPSAVFNYQTNRPWGGSVNFRAEILNSGAPGNVHFQVQYYEATSASWVPVNTQHTFITAEPHPLGGTLFNSVPINAADYGGWFPYLADQSIGRVIASDLLANWATANRSGAHKVRLAFTTDHSHSSGNILYSEEYTIMLDNILFDVNPDFGVAINQAYTLDLVIDGGDCHQYKQKEVFNGHLKVIDKYFGQWSLHLEPTSHYSGSPISPSSRMVINLIDNGDANAAWSLDTSTLDPCGYTVRLRGIKRTIFNSSVGTFHRRDKYVGFSVI